MEQRRSTALGILATPARALAMLQAAAQPALVVPGQGVACSESGDGSQSRGSAQAAHVTAGDGVACFGADGARRGAGWSAVAEFGGLSVGDGSAVVAGVSGVEGEVAAAGHGSRGPFGCAGHACGAVTVDPDKLLPRSTLVVHLSDRTLVDGEGMCRAEGVGPVTLAQLKRLLGNTRVTVRPVIHPDGVGPVDCYEIPAAVRRAVVLRHPFEVWPYGTRASGKLDLDHTAPYRWDGTPGQTRVGNLGPLSRRAHRAKTHAGWRVTQPEPGRFVWQSPLGRRYVVTTAGLTLEYSRAPGAQPWDDPTGGPILPDRPVSSLRRSSRGGRTVPVVGVRGSRPYAPLRR